MKKFWLLCFTFIFLFASITGCSPEQENSSMDLSTSENMSEDSLFGESSVDESSNFTFDDSADDSSQISDSSDSDQPVNSSESDSGKDTSDEISEDDSDEISDDDSSEISDDSLEPDIVLTNIAFGKSYSTDASLFRYDSYGDFENESGSICRYKLTDGNRSNSGSSHNIAGYNVGSLKVTIDLEGVQKISSISTDLWGGTWGIEDPSNSTVTFYYSIDGNQWILIQSMSASEADYSYQSDFRKADYTCSFSAVDARYVRVFYETNGDFVWTSEISVTGETVIYSSIPKLEITTSANDTIHQSHYTTVGIVLTDKSGKYDTIVDENAQIKIRGNSTSSGAKSPYNIKFEEKQDVLGMGKCKKWYLLANMYDKTQLRNKLAFDLANAIGMDYVQKSTFVNVYINGQYRGIYQLCESIGVGSSRVDIDTDGNEFLMEYEPWENYANASYYRTPYYGILLGFNDPDYPTDEQYAYLSEFFNNAEAAIHSHDINEIQKYIDVQSFVDAYIVQEFFKQVDYQTSSTRFYIKNGILYEGPVWDFDLSAGNCSSSYYTSYNNVESTGLSWQGVHCLGLWNRSLMKCEEFKQMVCDRLLELQPYIVNLYEDNELGQNQIDKLLSKYRNDIDYNYTIWSTSAVYSELEKIPEDGTYDSEIAYLKDWFKNRNEWLLTYYSK